MKHIFKKITVCLAVTFIQSIVNSDAQVITDKTFYDFGELNAGDRNYVDFKLTNVSSSEVRITKFETPYGVSLRCSDQNIAVDGSVLVRIKYTPRRKGEFNVDVPVYVSSNNVPIILSIRGKALSINIGESLDVPEFTSASEEEMKETFPLNIKVRRKDNKQPVDNAKMDILWDGVIYKKYESDEAGNIETKFSQDKYYLVVRAEGLGYFESELSIHPNIKEFIIELGPQGSVSSVEEDSSDIYHSEIAAEDQDTVSAHVALQEEESSELSNDEFLPNNIVFLIDVSVSMKQKGKMSLLKASMIELTNLLRSVDKVAIVTYSSKAEVALKSTSAAEKNKIIEVIQNLEPKGSTSGQKGLKKAYIVLESNRIQTGNNQVFISTDGAFNLDREDKGMIDIVRKNAKKGNKISVIGIKNDKWTIKNMKLIASEGHGNYLHITNYEDARTKLINEIKIQSRNSH